MTSVTAATDARRLVDKLWSFCDVLRDGVSTTESGTLGVIFRKAQNRIQDPAKLKRLIGVGRCESTSSGADADAPSGASYRIVSCGRPRTTTTMRTW